MRLHQRLSTLLVIAALPVAALGLAACTGIADATKEDTSPAKVEAIDGSKQKRITLRPEAAKRIGLKTEPILDAAGSPAASQAFGAAFAAGKTTMPYGALIYHADGTTYAYTATQPLTFTRVPVTVASIKTGIVALSAGPAVGTEIVTVGTAELHGLETGVGK